MNLQSLRVKGMKNILCYGDSNTHGYIPETGRRYPFSVRWTGILQQRLGSRARVIEEGLNGRTTVHDEALRVGKNGATYLPTLIESHSPIDLLVLMLGTNDILYFHEVSAYDAARGISRLIDLTRITSGTLDYPAPTILIVAPPVTLALPDEVKKLCPGDPAKSQQLARHFKQVAEAQQCLFFDAAEVVTASNVDGVHLDAENHHKLGVAIANYLSDFI